MLIRRIFTPFHPTDHAGRASIERIDNCLPYRPEKIAGILVIIEWDAQRNLGREVVDRGQRWLRAINCIRILDYRNRATLLALLDNFPVVDRNASRSKVLDRF